MASKPIKVAKLIQGRSIVNEQGQPLADFTRLINTNLQNLENAGNDTAELVADVVRALEMAGIAIQTVEQLAGEQNLTSSYTSPAGILSSRLSADGLSGEITIAAHTRIYGDGTQVAVDVDTIVGLEPSTIYYIYYDDPSKTGGAVTYLSSTLYSDAAQSNGRHSCGNIATPAVGSTEPIEGGGGVYPPGVREPFLQEEIK